MIRSVAFTWPDWTVGVSVADGAFEVELVIDVEEDFGLLGLNLR